MSVWVTGDVHGSIDIGKLSGRRWPEGKGLTRDDLLIVCGDFGMPWNGLPKAGEERFVSLSTETSDFFVCATEVEASPHSLVDALDAFSRPRGLMAMIAVFVAWTAGQPSLSSLIRGNLSLAAAVSHGLCTRADA